MLTNFNQCVCVCVPSSLAGAMSNIPDVAGQLFTTTYRNVKLAGKQPPAQNTQGTGSVSRGGGLSLRQCLRLTWLVSSTCSDCMWIGMAC